MSSDRPIRVLIVGAGAIGCFYGSRLHQAPRVLVSLVCRSNYRAIVGQGGVSLRTRSFGNYSFTPEYVFPSIDHAARPSATSYRMPQSNITDQQGFSSNITWDYIVVTTKALPDVSDDSIRLASLIGYSPRACIVLIQNGVGVEGPYRTQFPRTPILSAVTVASAEQVEEGVVVQNRWTRISVGPYTDGTGKTTAAIAAEGSSDRTADFVSLLKRGGIQDAELYDERGLQAVRWHKIAINAAMNPSAVLSNGTGNAEMVKNVELRHHLRECMLEVFRGAEAVLGEPLPSHLATPDQILTSTERNVGSRPSMLIDWEKGAKLELEVILGNPIRAARAKGVEMPRLHAMYGLLKMAQQKRDVEAREKLVSGGNSASPPSPPRVTSSKL